MSDKKKKKKCDKKIKHFAFIKSYINESKEVRLKQGDDNPHFQFDKLSQKLDKAIIEYW